MEKWSQRATLYKVTLLFTYFVFLVYGLAFSIPTWIGTEAAGIVPAVFSGLWLRCAGDDTADFDNCVKQAFGDDNLDWMDGVRGVWVGGMFFFLLGVLYSFVENCCGDEDSKDYGITGIFVLLAGLCGAAGVIVVAVKIEEDAPDTEYFWGYMLACIASGLALILAIVLLITRNVVPKEKSRANRTADYVFAHKPASPYAPEYTNHGFARDDIPLSNGVSYAHTPAAHPYTMYQGSSGVYPGNSLPHPRNQGGYGYDMGKSNQRHSLAESADLSNGYTTELINAEHSLSRSQAGYRGVDYIRNDFQGRNDYYGGRPY